MRNAAARDLVHAAPRFDASSRASNAAEHPQSLLDLPRGEARDSLLAVHGTLTKDLPRRSLAIYEAGGGSTSFLPFGVTERADITVVDIDAEQIRNNDYAHRKILGDIQTYRFAPDSFDLVICYNVIEHVPDVEATLEGFFEAVRPGGLILIGAPNPRSLSGFVTKYSPHWFHVWFYRHIRGDRNAGRPGHAPFPTVFHPLVTLSRLEAFADTHGLEVVYRRTFESPRYPEMRIRTPALARLVDAAAAALNFVLRGNTDVRHGDYHIILRRPCDGR